MAGVSHHPNLVSLIGIVEGGKKPDELTLLVLSYCENGSLKTVLSAGKIPLSEVQLVQFAVEIASGMAHLAAALYVHRDLAARNVLLDSAMQIKVADFGALYSLHQEVALVHLALARSSCTFDARVWEALGVDFLCFPLISSA